MGIPAAKRKLLSQKIEYRATGTLKDEDAEKYGPELSRIAEKCGGIAPPAAIVAEAKRKDNPLHDWIYRLGDAEAVVQHRLDQATYLIRHIIEIVVDEASGEEVQIRPFVHVEEEDDAGYRDRRSVSEADFHERRLNEAFNDLKSFVRRFADLRETAPITKMIRKLFKLRGEDE